MKTIPLQTGEPGVRLVDDHTHVPTGVGRFRFAYRDLVAIWSPAQVAIYTRAIETKNE